MIGGNIRRGVQLTIPYIYIQPDILIKDDGEPDNRVMQVLRDIWENYNVNIRYLEIYPDTVDIPEDEEDEDKETDIVHRLNFKVERVHESDMLRHIQPEIIACLFCKKETLPSNHKVFSKEEFLTEYDVIMSGMRMERKLQDGKRRYRRRRDN